MDLSRLEKILDKEVINVIRSKRVLLVGLGGVGGHAFDALLRMGINNITIIDNDVFDSSNINRQLLSNNNVFGLKKIDIAINHAKNVNSDVLITGMDIFLTKDNITSIEPNFDYIIDACDTVTTKISLIKYALTNKIKIIECLGTGNRLNPTKLEITTIDKTSGDPLAKIIRKLLKDEKINVKIPCICSTELPIKNGSRTPGSSSLVPSTAGIYAAYYIINDIITNI